MSLELILLALDSYLELGHVNLSLRLAKNFASFLNKSKPPVFRETSRFHHTEASQYFLENAKLEFCNENSSFGLTERLLYFKLWKPLVFRFELENFQVFTRNVKTRVLLENSSWVHREETHILAKCQNLQFLTKPPVLVLNNLLKISQGKWKLEFWSKTRVLLRQRAYMFFHQFFKTKGFRENLQFWFQLNFL